MAAGFRGPTGRLFLGDREEQQIHVHDKAQEYGNAADDRHQRQKDEGKQRAQSDGRIFSIIPHETTPQHTEIPPSEQTAISRIALIVGTQAR
jgi:hypothetical protein